MTLEKVISGAQHPNSPPQSSPNRKEKRPEKTDCQYGVQQSVLFYEPDVEGCALGKTEKQD